MHYDTHPFFLHRVAPFDLTELSTLERYRVPSLHQNTPHRIIESIRVYLEWQGVVGQRQHRLSANGFLKLFKRAPAALIPTLDSVFL